MAINWNSIRIAVFDLDGTLYEDTHHFQYYAKELVSKLPHEKQPLFWEDYYNMLESRHPVAIGRVYDVERDRILEVDPTTYKVKKTWNWNGEVVSTGEDYPGSVALDFHSMIAIGDGWWLPAAAAKHYGIGSTFDSYRRTKEYMQTKEFQFAEAPFRRQALVRLRQQCELVLLTNSEADDVERLLETLDLKGVFHHIIPNAKKPAQTRAHFASIVEEYDVRAEEVVSIGDNYLNDIVPAENMGMQAVLIDPQGKTPVRTTTERVRTLSELFSLI
ncbi:putative hydrolase of the HAD superfamily [Alteribacillus persepolensis]|uniref:Putative hydrolase of the HAD superfamily n=1 Tax=Alteribacillus persepolensis TaxID=568899 RepID=A0A1G8GDM0_9BACI|nr:HAD family hydrolase [Alteribacillus persepolensis]SDH92494.1 putative hydrolase of the HAD superfamily [Alteribacillus persepolensis]